ncbi:MAG: hypothetical protein CM1200mP11_2080 [Nitrosopumilaceae archaeon]|nr:MAG: hypothetical protein CM1200mP11_2080 [Nitrosopumilaceae archaeon]
MIMKHGLIITNYQKMKITKTAGIKATISRTNEWLAKVAQSIKAVDVIMNDGIQKMAESTAGKTLLEIGVFVIKNPAILKQNQE